MMPISQRISRQGLEQLIQYEGLSLKIYKDVAGYPTIGVGHLLTQSELFSGKHTLPAWLGAGETLDLRKDITKEQAFLLLREDLLDFEKAVITAVKVPLEQHQYDTLVSFAFNIGVSAFTKSTLVKKLNQGDYDAVPEQLMRWTKAGGRNIKGLMNRRKHEVAMWNGELHVKNGDPLKVNVRTDVTDMPTVLELEPTSPVDLLKLPEAEVLKMAEQQGLI